MFDRFTEDARRSLFFARAKSGERDGDEITAEDLLDGILLAAPDSVLRFVTANIDVLRPAESLQSPEAVEAWMMRLFREADPRITREIPVGIQAKRVLEAAVGEADSLGNGDITATHLLLGLLREEDTSAWRTLSDCGVALDGSAPSSRARPVATVCASSTAKHDSSGSRCRRAGLRLESQCLRCEHDKSNHQKERPEADRKGADHDETSRDQERSPQKT